jgi:tetratricopeptide (TPR) repeat protein
MNTRHLAVIMFTDIEGYTSLMQSDEAAAMVLRRRHREVFEAAHAKFNGKIVQYFGDGTLSTFSSSINAVECAIEMQAAFKKGPQVPLRIGIHLGDIITSGNDIAGDAVNVASRVESLGVPGSIFVSAKVHDDIKNQKGIRTESMGFFEFKNVAKPKEVFAIANSGLVVPEPESLVGKTKLKGEWKESGRDVGGVLLELWNRKVFLVAGAYLIGLWLLLLLANFIVSNYAVSPYWPDVLLVFFISFLPSVILHSYFHNKVEINRMRTVEKVSIPSNAMLSIALLAFLFYGKDLGATTRTVVGKDEFGNTVENEVVKDEFLKKINFYPFDNTSGDSTLDWLQNGIPVMLSGDMLQDDYTWCNYYLQQKDLGAKLAHAQSRDVPFFITGKFERKDSLYQFTSQLYDAYNGQPIHERTFNGRNIFNLGDEITKQLKKDVGLPEYHIQNAKDLPVSAIFTDNSEAFRYYVQAIATRSQDVLSGGMGQFHNHIQADRLDPRFALNNYIYASRLYEIQSSPEAYTAAIDKAMKHRTRVSDLYNMRIRTLYYKIHGMPEKAIALREMQADLNPEDKDAYNHLMGEYYLHGHYEKSLAACRKLQKLSPELLSYLKKLEAQMLVALNRPEEALAVMNEHVKRFPKDQAAFLILGEIYLAMEKLDASEDYFNKFSLMAPEHKGAILMLEHLHYLREKGEAYDPDMLKRFVGTYKHAGKEVTMDIVCMDNKVMFKTKNGGLFQKYTVNDSTLGGPNGVTTRFVKDQNGPFYKYIYTLNDYTRNVYRVDSSIEKAEKLLAEGNDNEALAAYREAYTLNPGHSFLSDYIQHLTFKSTLGSSSFYSRWQKLLGRYREAENSDANIKLTLEKDGLYWGLSDFQKVKLLPLNNHTFVTPELWGTRVQVKEEPEIGIILVWNYDDSSSEKSFVKVD